MRRVTYKRIREVEMGKYTYYADVLQQKFGVIFQYANKVDRAQK